MIWFIIATILLVLSVGYMIFTSIQYKRWDRKAKEAMKDKNITYSTCRSIANHRDRWETSGLVLGLTIGIIVCSILFVYIPIVVAQSWFGKNDKQELLNRYEMLVELKAQEKDITVQNKLFKDIHEYNQEVILHRHLASSSWTNWYYCDDYSDVPLIKISD